MRESAEMRYLQGRLTALVGALDGAYLFVLDGAEALEGKPQNLQGEMPRRSRFGYIFTSNSPNGISAQDHSASTIGKGAHSLSPQAIAYTIAHELGHGLFTLQHTFDHEYGGKKTRGTTPNLMDYAGGRQLAAFQWNVLHNPAPFTALDNANASAIVREQTFPIKGTGFGVAPDGRVIAQWGSKNPKYGVVATITPNLTDYIYGFQVRDLESEKLIKEFYWNGATYMTSTGESIE